MTSVGLSQIRENLGCTLQFFGTTAFCLLLLGFFAAYGSALLFVVVAMGVMWIPLYMIVFLWLWWNEGIAPALVQLRSRGLLGIAPPAFLIATLLGALPLLWLGSYLGHMSRLAINYQHYERIVALARNEGTEEWFAESKEGITYSVDPGPPVRVAFNPEGMLDNWGAIVFDPSGEMINADGFDPVSGEFFAPDSITKLFGGDLVSCRHLWGDYYTCSWT